MTNTPASNPVLSPSCQPLVLVADDNPGILRLVQTILEQEPWELVKANDGDEAWQLIQERRPQVALLDWRMPGRSGTQIITALRATPELATTQVVMLTGNCHSAELQYAYEAGADRVITKPFSPLLLLEAISEALAA